MDITLDILYEETQIIQMGGHTRNVTREFPVKYTIERTNISGVRERVGKKGIVFKSCVVMMDDGSELIAVGSRESVYAKIYGRGRIGY